MPCQSRILKLYFERGILLRLRISTIRTVLATRWGGGGCNTTGHGVGEGFQGGGELGSSPVGEGVPTLELLKQKKDVKII